MSTHDKLDIWQLAAKVNRMDTELGAIWLLLRDKLGGQPYRADRRQIEMFGEETRTTPPISE